MTSRIYYLSTQDLSQPQVDIWLYSHEDKVIKLELNGVVYGLKPNLAIAISDAIAKAHADMIASNA